MKDIYFSIPAVIHALSFKITGGIYSYKLLEETRPKPDILKQNLNKTCYSYPKFFFHLLNKHFIFFGSD